MDGGGVLADAVEDAHGQARRVERPHGPLDVPGVADAGVGDEQDARRRPRP